MIDYASPPVVQVFDHDIRQITEISAEAYDYFCFTRNLYTPGEFELHINKNEPKAAYLLDPSAFIVAYYDGVVSRAGIIEKIECSLDSDSGVGGEILKISGRSGGMFAVRLAVAGTGSGTGYDTLTGPAEELMRHYVEVNAVDAQDAVGDTAPERNVPNLILEPAPTVLRGTECTYSARFEPLAEILESLAYAGGVGWEIIFDREASQFVFRVLQGTDHTITSDRPVILKTGLNNIEEIDYTYSVIDSKSLAYVGGSGKDASRVVSVVSLSETAPSGFSRREVFVNSSNTEDAAELVTVGEAELQQSAGNVSLNATLNLSFGAIQYQTDYDLGDRLTVEYSGVAQVDVSLISVLDETVGDGRGTIRKISATLGTEPTDIRRIVRRTSQKTIEELQ